MLAERISSNQVLDRCNQISTIWWTLIWTSSTFSDWHRFQRKLPRIYLELLSTVTLEVCSSYDYLLHLLSNTVFCLGSNQISSGSSIQEITDSPEGSNQQPSPQLVPTRTAGSNSSVITGPGTSAGISQQQQSSVSSIIAPSTIQYSAKVFAQGVSDSAASASSVITVQQQQLNSALGNFLGVQFGQQPAIVVNNVPLVGSISESSRSSPGSSDDITKDTKPRLSRSFPRLLG